MKQRANRKVPLLKGAITKVSLQERAIQYILVYLMFIWPAGRNDFEAGKSVTKVIGRGEP
jgi:hypothetical protein